MTRRLPCPAVPESLEGYAARLDDLFGSLAQRRGFREYLAGLLAPWDRNKTLTALAGAEPVTGAQHPAVQRLQFFLSESRWDPEGVNARRLELLLADPATAPHEGGVLMIDDSGDRKETSAPKTPARCAAISPCVSPFADREITISPAPVSRRCRFATIFGSKVDSRSRGTLMSTGPVSVSTVWPGGRCGNSRHHGPRDHSSHSRGGHPVHLRGRPR
jgi:hypothetical protein